MSLSFALTKNSASNCLRYLAKTAALVAVLAFFADPFSQQLVQYVDCSEENSIMTAELSRTNTYAATGGFLNPGEAQLDADIYIAMYTGIYNPPRLSSSLVDVDCQSGNCTFPNFQTLGVCEACEDISDRIVSTPLDLGILNYTINSETSNRTILWAGRGMLLMTYTPSTI